MFGKLMKYELKATYKWYLIISGVLAILSIFAGLLASSVITGQRLIQQIQLIQLWELLSWLFLQVTLA